jgi:pyrroline-5-carboxylate reductase
MKIAFIGVGFMGEAIIAALLEGKLARPRDIYACDIDPARLAAIGKKYKVSCASGTGKAISNADVIVLAVKPQSLAAVMTELKGELEESQLIFSIVAGARLDTIRRGLEHEAIIRAMPNTPAQVKQGMSVWTATDAVTQAQKDMAKTILDAMGEEIYVADEKYIDMATAVSGSGPAYIFLMMEALIDAAVHIGLPRKTAEKLVAQTVLGSAYLSKETGKHAAELKNMVTSPGGTTAEGLLCLEKGGLRAIIAQAVIAAYEKAQRLGGQSSK